MTQGYITACKTHKKNLLIAALFLAVAFLWIIPHQSTAATGIAKASSPQRIFVTVKAGDTLASIFKKQGISAKTLASMAHLPIASQPMRHLHIGQHMRFTLDAQHNLQSFALSLSSSKTLVVLHTNSRFIARIENNPLKGSEALKKIMASLLPQKVMPEVDLKPAKTVKQTAPLPTSVYPGLHYTGMIIHSSLYADGKKQGIPYAILAQLVKIFALQINFKDIRPGDKLVLAYDREYIVAAKFTHGSRIYAIFRYVNAQGVVEYFTPEGEGTQKAFNRFPVKYTHINSLFNMHRMHPVTHVIRPHTGVDLAAPLGTPIYSIGNGKIGFIGWDGAYGNLVKIQHDAKYSSMYAHMLRFAPGLSVGSYVKRGQLIGFLGQTGNATGPHIHFEIRVYNKPVNPLTVPLPYSSSIPASQTKAFQTKSKNLMAALDYYQRTQLK